MTPKQLNEIIPLNYLFRERLKDFHFYNACFEIKSLKCDIEILIYSNKKSVLKYPISCIKFGSFKISKSLSYLYYAINKLEIEKELEKFKKEIRSFQY